MKIISLKPLILTTAILGSTLTLFQNCGPAKLSGDAGSLSSIATEGGPSSTLVGTKVDLNALLPSAQESSNNILYPSASVMNQFDYALNAPIIENLVLRANDFTKIIWVHAPSSTVVAVGDSFNQMNLNPDLLGIYYVFGYRNQTPYIIEQFQIVNKEPATLSINSVGAVQITQRLITSDAQNEWILVQVNAPNVDLNSLHFTLNSSGAIFSNKRAILVEKKLSESLNIQVNLSDLSGQSSSFQMTLTAKSTAIPTPIPVPTSALPDIIVTSLSMNPANPTAGHAVTFSATVKNQGSGATPAGLVIGLQFQVDGQTVSYSNNYSTSLAPGASATLTANDGPSGSAAAMTSGSHLIQAWVNNASLFSESNTANNQFSMSLMVPPTSFQLKAQISGLCIRPQTTPLTAGTLLLQGPCDTGALSFTETLSGDTIRLQVINTNLCVDIYAGGTTNGVPVQLWTCNTASINQNFIPATYADGFRSFAAAVSGLCIDITAESPLAGAMIQQWTCRGNVSQQKFIKAW